MNRHGDAGSRCLPASSILSVVNSESCRDGRVACFTWQEDTVSQCRKINYALWEGKQKKFGGCPADPRSQVTLPEAQPFKMALETRSSSTTKTRNCCLTFRVESLNTGLRNHPMSFIGRLLFSAIPFYFLSLTVIKSRSRSLAKPR